MPTPAITVSGRCTHCLAPVQSTAGCQSCWARSLTEAAYTVLHGEDHTLPEFGAARISENLVPVFQSLLRTVGG